MKNISVEEKTKQRFDDVQITESGNKSKRLNQNETMKVLLDLWEQVEAGVLEIVEK